LKKISVITTGGTIGSLLGDASVVVAPTEKYIADEIAQVKDKLECTVVLDSPINKNSENFTPIDWLILLEAIKKANDSDSDGIVITHGSDTLAYSVAAALAFSHLWTKKICFTGAYYAPNHPLSDTSLNLSAALAFSSSSYPEQGVYVAFRANGENSEAKIMQGKAIKPMEFDALFFDSTYGETVATFSPEHGLLSDISLPSENSPCLDAMQLPTVDDIQEASAKVGMIVLYPGIDRKMLDAAVEGRDILIIQAYHCGTGPSEANSDLIRFIEEVRSRTKVLIATFPQKYISVPYESTLKLIAAGAHIYADLQVHFLYVFSVLGLSVSLSPDDVVDKMSVNEVLADK